MKYELTKKEGENLKKTEEALTWITGNTVSPLRAFTFAETPTGTKVFVKLSSMVGETPNVIEKDITDYEERARQ